MAQAGTAAPAGKMTRSDPMTIARLIAPAYLSKLSAETLTLANAREFLEIVSKAAKCFEVTDVKDARRQAKKNKNGLDPRYGVKTGTQVLRRRSAQLAKLAEKAQKAWNELIKSAFTANVILPEALVKHLYAGLAGANLVPAQLKTPPGEFALPPESRAASSMQRQAAALAAQASRAVATRDPGALQKVFTLSAQLFMYGIIMRLVRGDLAQVDKIMELLRKRNQRAYIINKIKKGELDSATETLSDLVLETTDFDARLAA